MAENLGPKGEIACFVTLLAAKVHTQEDSFSEEDEKFTLGSNVGNWRGSRKQPRPLTLGKHSSTSPQEKGSRSGKEESPEENHGIENKCLLNS